MKTLRQRQLEEPWPWDKIWRDVVPELAIGMIIGLALVVVAVIIGKAVF
jgi:hypothetical protein